MTEAPKPEYRGGYVPIANLWTAAADALALHRAHHDDANRRAFDDAMDALAKAIEGITEARNGAKALEHITDSVGQVGKQDGDVDIIGDWTHHNGSPAGDGGGYWVDAWVWVEDESEDGDEGEDSEP